MREDVGAAPVLRDEAEALFRVEPLDGTAGHAFAFQPISDPHRADPEVVVLVQGTAQQTARTTVRAVGSNHDICR
ncbi:hypothetical protein GCM10010216_61840 [Streptomyces flaveolus]|nr:hypothetical protein GCM10010216_61840 [Streptomyces flaveolus]